MASVLSATMCFQAEIENEVRIIGDLLAFEAEPRSQRVPRQKPWERG